MEGEVQAQQKKAQEEQKNREEEQKKKEGGKSTDLPINEEQTEELELEDLLEQFPKDETEDQEEEQEENIQKKANDQAGKSLLSLIAVLSAKRVDPEKQAKYIEQYIQFNEPVLEQLDFFELYGSMGQNLSNNQKLIFSLISLVGSAFIVPKMID